MPDPARTRDWLFCALDRRNPARLPHARGWRPPRHRTRSAPPATTVRGGLRTGQHATVDPERLQDGERVVEGEDVGGG